MPLYVKKKMKYLGFSISDNESINNRKNIASQENYILL